MNIFCDFIPQVLFLSSLFGYLCILIFVKWIAFSPSQSYEAPSLLIGILCFSRLLQLSNLLIASFNSRTDKHVSYELHLRWLLALLLYVVHRTGIFRFDTMESHMLFV